MIKKKYSNLWLCFVDIKAKDGANFNNLIDFDGSTKMIYIGAWGNILIKSETIREVIDIIENGLGELGFAAKFIDKIENFSSLVEYKEANKSVVKEADWLLKSDFVFMISDKLFPY